MLAWLIVGEDGRHGVLSIPSTGSGNAKDVESESSECHRSRRTRGLSK